MLAPVALVETVDSYLLATGWRMHEAAVTNIDSDVGKFLAFLVEEHQVTYAQRSRCDRYACLQLRSRRAWNRDAGA